MRCVCVCVCDLRQYWSGADDCGCDGWQVEHDRRRRLDERGEGGVVLRRGGEEELEAAVGVGVGACEREGLEARWEREGSGDVLPVGGEHREDVGPCGAGVVAPGRVVGVNEVRVCDCVGGEAHERVGDAELIVAAWRWDGFGEVVGGEVAVEARERACEAEGGGGGEAGGRCEREEAADVLDVTRGDRVGEPVEGAWWWGLAAADAAADNIKRGRWRGR